MLDISDEIENSQQTQPNEGFLTLPYEKDDDESKKIVHKWLLGERNYLVLENNDRVQAIKKNLLLNKGVQYRDQEFRSTGEQRDAGDGKKQAVEKMVINKLKEASRVRASKILKYKPNVSILPTNDELGDKVAAEMTKNLIDHIWYLQRYDGVVLPRLVNNKGPMGESYNRITWNPNLGDVAEQYKKAKVAAETQAKSEGKSPKEARVPLMENGKQKLDERGEPIWIQRPIKNGDVEYNIVMALNLFFDKHPSNEIEKARYSFEEEVMTYEEACISYPKATQHIDKGQACEVYDFEKGQMRTQKNSVKIWHFNHKRTDYFEKGRYVVFTDKGILSSKDFPYDHRRLPYVRHLDMENPGEMHGPSFFEDCKQIFGAFNNINNLILRNEIMVGHPKWMVPDGAADIRELGNAITVVRFKGPVSPQLVQANPTGQGAYNLRNMLKEEGMEMADVSRTGNGNPPQGITAAVALQYLSELEQERWNTSVLFHNESILQTVLMSISICGTYYDVDDKRQIRIQGDDGGWQSAFYDVTNLSKDYDIRVQSASATAETTAARTESLLFMAEKFPQSVEAEQVLDQLGLAQNKKFIKEATISLRASEAENEMFAKEKDVPDPEEYEDQLVHWKSHLRYMREWSFKNTAPKEMKEKIIDHMTAHEMIMCEMALKNPEIQKVLAMLPGFPIFFSYQDMKNGLPMPPEGDEPLPQESGGVPYDQPMGDGRGIQLPEELPVQPQEGVDLQANIPPVDQQLGMEAENVEPTNQI